MIAALLIGSLAAISHSERPIRCVTPVLSRQSLNAAIEQPVQPFIQNRTTPERLPVGPAAERALRTVLEQVVACSNAGEPLRVWSLYAPAYLARLYQIQGPFTESMYSAYAKPLPDESRSGMRVVGIDDLWQSGDGRYGIEATMRYPSVPMPKRLIFWCVNSSDGLRIEEVVGEISFSLP